MSVAWGNPRLCFRPLRRRRIERCVCGCPRSDHAAAEFTGLTWCIGPCDGCDAFAPQELALCR